MSGLFKKNNLRLFKEQIEKGKELKQEHKRLKPQLREIEEKYQKLIPQIPNLPADDVKSGKDESENEVVKTQGEKTKFDFEPKDHQHCE